MSTPKAQPNNSLRLVRFCTLAGVDTAHLEGGLIVGQFKKELRDFCGPRTGTLIEQFVNWQNDADSWLRFTRRYGPLREVATRGATFRVETKQFREVQEGFQKQWRDKKRSGWQLGNCPVTLTHLSGKTALRVSNLHWFLFLDLVTQDPKRLKVCERPDCSNPFFVTPHLGQLYCGSICSAWAQKQWKKKWWGEHGEDWRSKQQQHEQSEDKNGKRQSSKRNKIK